MKTKKQRIYFFKDNISTIVFFEKGMEIETSSVLYRYEFEDKYIHKLKIYEAYIKNPDINWIMIKEKFIKSKKISI
jgi:hypothetical protein